MELFAEFDRPDVPGACALVARNGEVVVSKSYGLANLGDNIPCFPPTNFRLASLTKQFTAMCIMMLAERGQLKLDQRLPDFFPRFPEYGAAITVRHLLTHTSGLADYEDLIPGGTTKQLRDADVLEILQEQDGAYFSPGAKFRYSNGGYALLALIVENVSGKRFAAWLRENIFQPIGMHNTLAYERGVSEIPHRALGYTQRGTGFHEVDQSLTSAVLGDGGIYSSIADLLQWDRALYGEKLVSREMLREAFTEACAGYGFGWFVDNEKVWHYGETCGFTTRIERHLKNRLTIIILCNRRDADLAPIAAKLKEATQ
jgi:CubicO group peptidase (beta-lactamase class C family)